MTNQAIIDAGPALNFCSINKQNLIIQVVGGGFLAPQTVSDEVKRKATDRKDTRFNASNKVWTTLAGSRFLTILDDDPNDISLVKALTRVGGRPADLTRRQAKDLGERMVLAHASVMVQKGIDVTVIIDDGGGQQLYLEELDYLTRHQNTANFGSLDLLTTPTILTAAIHLKLITSKQDMRDIYKRLRELDDGLFPIEKTDLLTHPNWALI